MPDRVLHYAGSTEPTQLTIDELPDGGVTITVPTRRSWIRWIGYFDIWGIVLMPVFWLVFTLLKSRKPRAVLRLTQTEFIVTETADDGLGWTTTSRSWPRHEIGEVRTNRYDDSLHLRIPGQDMVDLLQDVPPNEIEAISEALAAATERLNRNPPPAETTQPA